MPTADPAPQDLRKELDRLAQEVDLWFRQASRRLKAPSDRSCLRIWGAISHEVEMAPPVGRTPRRILASGLVLDTAALGKA
jgi:hypothetical protein